MATFAPQPNNNLSERDLALLSAYLDDEMTAAEREGLEQRLQAEPELRAELEELRTTITMLHGLAPVTPPRSFTLDPDSVPAPRPLLFEWLGRLQRHGAIAATVLALAITTSVLTLTLLGGQVSQTFETVSQGLDGGGAPEGRQSVAAAPTAEAAAAEMAEQEPPTAEVAAEAAPAAEMAEAEDEAIADSAAADQEELADEPASAPALTMARPTAARATPAPTGLPMRATAPGRLLPTATRQTRATVAAAAAPESPAVSPTAPESPAAMADADDARPAETTSSMQPDTVATSVIGSSDTSSPDTRQLATPDQPSRQTRPAGSIITRLLVPLAAFGAAGLALAAWLLWRRRSH